MNSSVKIISGILIFGMSFPASFAGEADGIFGDYFGRMVGVCAPGYILSGFSDTPSTFGTKSCISLKDPIGSIFGTTPPETGKAVLGFDTTGGLILGSVLWEKSATNNNIYYTNGSVGIGTNAPSVKLDVAGEIQAQNLYGQSVYMGGDAAGEDIEIGSYTPGAKNITFWNKGDVLPMSIAANNARVVGKLLVSDTLMDSFYSFQVQGKPGEQTTALITGQNGIMPWLSWPTGWSGLSTHDILARHTKLGGNLMVGGNVSVGGTATINGATTINGNTHITGNVTVDGSITSTNPTTNTGPGCPVDNIVEGDYVYGRAMGFDDAGGGNDFYICCRDKKMIYFGMGGRSSWHQKCDEFGNINMNVTAKNGYVCTNGSIRTEGSSGPDYCGTYYRRYSCINNTWTETSNTYNGDCPAPTEEHG